MSPDTRLQDPVLAEPAWDPGVTAAHSGVTAKAGVETLTGHVETFAEKHAAKIAAHRCQA
ncbi:MAG: BON domain-containing protein [Rhodopila sp.]|jgi:osmotically-inducible protein OsmY